MRAGPALLVALGLGTLALGTLSGLAAVGAADTYQDLEGPAWKPPPWVFGPVWSVLYVLIGASLWFALRGGLPRSGIVLWGAQLTLNLAWTPLFFLLEWRGVALLDILALAVAIVVTGIRFAPHSRLAAGLLAPYLLWVGFATALNAAFWWMNR
jgi:translocator protein